MGDMLSPALAYALAGWEIFPLSRSKAPAFPSAHPEGDPERGKCKGACGRVGHGLYDASCDEAVVRAWWSARPYRNIGGRVPGSLLVLDIDPHGGGDETLVRLQREHGPLPETLTCYSGRGDGGRHLYYRRPPGPLTGVGFKPGIDLVHHGLRYTVLPPSRHPATGKPYVWADPYAPPADLPLWAVALLRPKPAPVRAPSRFWDRQMDGNAGARLVRYVRGHDTAEGSGRHDVVLWALCRAAEQNLGPAVTAELVEAAVDIGKDRREAESMAEWAGANVKAVV